MMKSPVKRASVLFRNRLLLAFFVFSFSISAAQDFKKSYRKAKELFQNGKYSEAMDAFNALTVYDKNNPYTEYAQFFYGLSAQRLGFYTVAKNQWVQLRRSYPQWTQID
ncbi:MAG: tetratricopeptide repeat protein, partial [Bacteroidota bacterium]